MTPSAQDQNSDVQTDDPVHILTLQINGLERRLKILEDRYATMRKKTQNTDEGLLALEKKFSKDDKLSREDLLELKRSLALLSEKMNQFASEISQAASRSSLKELETYLSFFEPLQFATRSDLKTGLAQLQQQLTQEFEAQAASKSPDESLEVPAAPRTAAATPANQAPVKSAPAAKPVAATPSAKSAAKSSSSSAPSSTPSSSSSRSNSSSSNSSSSKPSSETTASSSSSQRPSSRDSEDKLSDLSNALLQKYLGR